LGHSKNNEVDIGDIFLFFSWFRKTEVIDDKLRYVSSIPGNHITYVYLHMGEMISNGKIIPNCSPFHSHANEIF